MKKQTAVEWLFNKTMSENNTFAEWDKIANEAREMEKQQIIEAYRNGRTDQQTGVPKFYDRTSLKYYNETFEL